MHSIEQDEFTVGNLLFADGSSLKTTNGTVTKLIIGTASGSGLRDGVGRAIRLSAFNGFVQPMENYTVIIADTGNHCMRQLDRRSLTISGFSGSCGRPGYRDGSDPLFNFVYDVIHDKKNSTQLIVADLFNKALRGINIHTGHTRTLLKHRFCRFNQLIQDIAKGDIFVTFIMGVARYDYSHKTVTLLAGEMIASFSDGGYSLFANPWGVKFLNLTALLIADSTNNQLKILNLETLTSASICSGEQGHLDGNLTSCQMTNPLSLLTVNRTIYVGGFTRIYTIAGEELTMYLKIIFYQISIMLN